MLFCGDQSSLRLKGPVMYSFLGEIVRLAVVKLLGKAWDGVSGGDPLDPDYDFVEVEQGEKDPLHQLRVIEVELPRDTFRRVLAIVDGKLDKGFREVQQQILFAQSGKLREGERFQLLCHLFHEGAPTGLQIDLLGREEGKLFLQAQGRGPAADVFQRELEKSGFVGREEKGVPPGARERRDGRFRRDQWGLEWRAALPIESGTLFGQPLALVAEVGRPGLVGGGDVGATPLVREILENLPGLLAVAGPHLASYEEGEDIVSLVSNPKIWLSAEVGDERAWTLVVERVDWEDFGWHLEFQGLDFVEIWAGD